MKLPMPGAACARQEMASPRIGRTRKKRKLVGHERSENSWACPPMPRVQHGMRVRCPRVISLFNTAPSIASCVQQDPRGVATAPPETSKKTKQGKNKSGCVDDKKQNHHKTTRRTRQDAPPAARQRIQHECQNRESETSNAVPALKPDSI